MTIRATWRVCDNHRTPCEQPKTDDALLAVVLSGVLNLKRLPRKNEFSIGEIQSSFQQSLVSLGQIEGDTHLSYCKYKNIAQSGGNNFAGLAVLAIDPKSGSYPVAGSASGGLNGPSVGAILSLT